MNETFVTGSADLQWAASRVEIRTRDLSEFANGTIMFMLNTDLDDACHKLSRALPGAEIKVTQCARLRAVYKNGVRIFTKGMREFYLMTEEEYKSYDLNNSLYNGKDQPFTF